LCLVAAAAPAEAQRLYSRVNLDARVNAGELDLAEQAGEEPSGESQTSTGAVGLAIAVGVSSADVRIGVEVGVAAGGLDRAEIDELYFGSTGEGGRSVSASLGLAAAIERPLRPKVVGIGRLGLGYSLMNAESGANSAAVESFYMDVGGGVGLDLDTPIPSRLEAIAALRVHRLNRLDVTGLTEGRIAADAPAVFVQPGALLGYVLLF
jgi:hypothetical protein